MVSVWLQSHVYLYIINALTAYYTNYISIVTYIRIRLLRALYASKAKMSSLKTNDLSGTPADY